ncbi:Crp/Fnr family transcriptional regulator [Sulfitobacter sp. D35]|uniref:transcriptional regulator FnrL n=1 Tax=Sulfitobacter sp. D35 TaxID=3083252 RepID=UPI00296EF094|nr:Crp/Fnr family transcriptional regulator [Sulfitobacter sp. D35]MDW4498559.1 Crp/Fnr family transcriptional regulator [Sulfitobacter sp. D35]
MTISLNTRVTCDACPIRHRAICSRCDSEELSLLERIKSYRTYKAGETILWRGDDLHFVASVVKGVATLGKTLEDGRTQVVGLLLPSDFVGRPGRPQIDFDVTAVTDVTLCCFERGAFEELLTTTPHVAERMVEIALDELDAARDWMLLLGRKTAREKIATFVEMLVRRQSLAGGGATGAALSLPLTRDEIANYLGLTLETVSRQMTALRREGVIEFADRRRFEVKDLSALHVATGDDADGGPIS